MSAEKRKTILLVEDEAIIAMTEKMTLDRFGYDVIIAGSGEAAVEIVEKNPDIDLILMDIDLGAGMDGTEAAALILKDRDLPVVFLSSHMEPEIVARTEKITSYGYVVKDSSGTVLDASIKMAFKLFAAKVREKKKEEALAHSRELMQYVIEHMSSAVAVHDRDLRYIFVSQRYLDDYKLQERDIIGKHHYDVFPDLPQKWRDVHQRALAGEISRAEDDPFQRQDGSLEWTRWECRPWFEADGSIGGIIVYTEVTTERKLVELKLAQNLDLLTKLARLVPGVIYQYRLDPNGRSAFPYASPGINDIYEVTPEEVREDATPVFGRLHPDDYDMVAGAIQASALTLNAFFCEFRVILPRQGLRWRWSQAHPERLADGGTLWHGIISDITERKLAEEALRENEERMRAIVEGTPHLFFYTQDADANSTYVSSTIERITGYSTDTWIKRKDWFLTDNPLNRSAKERTRGHLRGEFRREPLLLEIRHAQGHAILLEVYEYPITKNGMIVGLQGVAHDITERQQAEEALQENDSRLELAMQAADMAWWEMDLASGHVTFEKRKAEVLGYPPEKFKHYQDFVALVHPDDREKTMNAMRGHLDGSLPRYEVDYRIAGSSGEYVWFHDIGSIGDRDAHGKPLNVTGLVINISARKQAEAEIHRQLTEKEILLKEVHHRIKNNFAAIGGLLSLHMQAITSPEAVAALQDAIGRVDSMRLLYEKLLLGGDFHDASAKNYIESLATSVVALFPDLPRVKLNLDVGDFKLDPKRLFPLGIIINELLTNIMKHAFAGKKSGAIKLSLAKDGARVTLTLQDDGVGLPSGFDISSAKGFGLTLVKMLSQQLGGSFSIEKHKGTRCTVIFDV